MIQEINDMRRVRFKDRVKYEVEDPHKDVEKIVIGGFKRGDLKK